MAFIREVWYGQRSLEETFWLWNMLIGGIVLGQIVKLIAQAIAIDIGSLYPVYLYIAFSVPYSIWNRVGLWRSASNSEGCWAGGVKILLIIGIILEIIGWFVLIFAPDTRNLLLHS